MVGGFGHNQDRGAVVDAGLEAIGPIRPNQRVGDDGLANRSSTVNNTSMPLIIRKRFVSFAVTESGRHAPPTPADIRAWRKQYPYGTGGPPPRSVRGELLLEIHSHPWVTTRRNFRDTEEEACSKISSTPSLSGSCAWPPACGHTH